MKVLTLTTCLPIKAYDTQAILDAAKRLGMEAVIPPKKNRKEQRWFDREIYKLRHLIENAFLALKNGVASQHAMLKLSS